MLNFVENLLENERDPRSGPMNDQDDSLSLSDPDRSLVLSHFLTNFLQNLASCHTAFTVLLSKNRHFSNVLINVTLTFEANEVRRLKRLEPSDLIAEPR
jgi:hypothetical protein